MSQSSRLGRRLASTSSSVLALGVLLACGSSAPSNGRDDLPAFCARDGENLVRDVFCADRAPEIRSLRDLLTLLKLDYFTAATAQDGTYPTASEIDPRVVVLGHSTALSGRLVSPINPRVILMGRNAVVAFNRGVQQVEVIGFGSGSRTAFYLIDFEQACNATVEGCGPGDLYTPRIESSWLTLRIQDDEDLKNTPSDCRQCHQRGSSSSQLLMRELEGPWTHFFMPDEGQERGHPEPTGVDLTVDYLSAKGDEPYAAVPAAVLRATAGFSLENFIGSSQPLLFDSTAIANERWPHGPDGYPPAAQRSPTWERAYEAFKRGERLALPHFEPRPTDASKQAQLTNAYQRYRSGELPAEQLPDLADIFPDDPQLRAEIGLQTEPGATPAETLIQACGSCHNDVLDQSLSRARFNIDLSRMDRAERELAIERINMPNAARMPPPESRQLDAQSRERLIEYLRQDSRSAEDDALLARAAQLGMAQAE